jgi:hypothetical protein
MENHEMYCFSSALEGLWPPEGGGGEAEIRSEMEVKSKLTP